MPVPAHRTRQGGNHSSFSHRRQTRGSGCGVAGQEGPWLMPPPPTFHQQHPWHQLPAGKQVCAPLRGGHSPCPFPALTPFPRSTTFPVSPTPSRAWPQQKLRCAKLKSSALAKPSPAWAVLDLTPSEEKISTTLQAVSGFILEFIKFQCHPYS